MQIELYLPGEFEADVAFDEAARKVVVTPKVIPKKAKELTVVSVLVSGAKGNESRANCTVNSQTGRVGANNLDCGGVADFDKGPGEPGESGDVESHQS